VFVMEIIIAMLWRRK